MSHGFNTQSVVRALAGFGRDVVLQRFRQLT